MTEPDWARAWELLEEYKKNLNPKSLALQRPLLDAIADLLNKQDPSGYKLIRQFFIQDSMLKFYQKYADKVYAYREWFDDRVELNGEFYQDLDAAYRDAFEEQHDKA